MGEAKRRRTDNRTAALRGTRVKIRDPEEHAHIPGTLTIHVLHDSGALVTGALPLEDLDEIISTGEAVARTSGYATAREDARNYIASTIAKGEHLRDGAPQTIAALAVWLAWTAPEPQGAMMRG